MQHVMLCKYVFDFCLGYFKVLKLFEIVNYETYANESNYYFCC